MSPHAEIQGGPVMQECNVETYCGSVKHPICMLAEDGQVSGITSRGCTEQNSSNHTQNQSKRFSLFELHIEAY